MKGRRPPRRGSRGPARHDRDTLRKGCRAGCRLQGERGAPGVTGAQWRMPRQPKTRRAAPAGARRVEATRGPRPPRPRRCIAPGKAPAADGQGRQARTSGHAGLTGAVAHQARRDSRPMISPRRRREEKGRRPPRRGSRGPARHNGDTLGKGCRVGCRLQGRRGAPGVTGAQWRTPWQPTTRRAAPAGARRVEAARGPKPPRPRRRTAPGRTPAAAGQGRQARNARSAGRTGVAAHQPRRAGRHKTRLERRRRIRTSTPRQDG